jgi:hypothetical protein
MTIIIRTVGNRSLYRDLYAKIDSETKHRTASGAADRLIKIARQSRRWGETMGQWGSVEIEIDGKKLDHMDVFGLFGDADEAAFGHEMDRWLARSRLISALDWEGRSKILR